MTKKVLIPVPILQRTRQIPPTAEDTAPHLKLTSQYLSRIKEDYCFQGRHDRPRETRRVSVGDNEFGLPIRWSALILRLGNRKTDYLDPLKEGL